MPEFTPSKNQSFVEYAVPPSLRYIRRGPVVGQLLQLMTFVILPAYPELYE